MTLTMRSLKKYLFVSFLIVSSAQAGNAYLPNDKTASLTAAPMITIPNAKQAFPGILTGGQPSEAQLIEAQQKGYKTVINLRPAAEQNGLDEGDQVKKLGMHYINIPVSGVNDLTSANSQALNKALSDINTYPVLIHCASGNRVGALFALDAHQRAQLPIDAAIDIGKKAGLTHLEDTVRKLSK